MNKIESSPKNCPVCGSKELEDYLNIDLTTFFFPLSEELIKKARKEPLKLKICQKCSFIVQVDVKNELIELIYNEFYKHYNLDTSIDFQEVYRERTIKFMTEILSKDKNSKALDLGCGEGTYFPFFESLGHRCYGIEPSEKASIAKDKNPNATISPEFFESLDAKDFGGKFDVILMNWVLEHISDLDFFFGKLEGYLKNNTKLIVQVPDIMYYIDNDLPLFYVHEHINYFTIQTLTLLLERKGFKIISQKNGDTPSILICAEYVGKVRQEEFNNTHLIKKQKSFLLKNIDLRDSISKTISAFDEVIFYGAGLLSFWIGDSCFNNKNLNNIEVIDDNVFYKNKFLPVFNKKIKKFPKGHSFNDTLIIIGTSPVYHDKIKRIISEKYIGNFKIATVKENTLVIEE
jgi:2-polyprenyl-3-methyl-5-hydroxy-6-metoxy-1,4-benzoquinol methylase